jgi:hypothetical protein
MSAGSVHSTSREKAHSIVGRDAIDPSEAPPHKFEADQHHLAIRANPVSASRDMDASAWGRPTAAVPFSDRPMRLFALVGLVGPVASPSGNLKPVLPNCATRGTLGVREGSLSLWNSDGQL